MTSKYELRHLRHFITVAEELNFRRAAKILNLAQPPLSRSIQQLEDYLGFSLFNRTSRKVQLTAEGEIFLEGAYFAIKSLQATENKVKKYIAGEQGEIFLGYTDFATIGLFPTIINQFRNAFPHIQLNMQHNVTYRQIELISERELDFGFVTGPISGPNLNTITVQRDRLIAVISEEHHLASRKSVSITELKNENFIMGEETGWKHFYRHIQAICLSRGFQPKVAQEACNTEGIFGFITANMGITLHVSSLSNYYRKGTVIIEIDDVDETIPTQVVWNEDELKPTSLQFIAFINDNFNLDTQE